MFKKIFRLVAVLSIVALTFVWALPVHLVSAATNYYAVLTTGNHNWSSTATWSSTADGLTTPTAGVPTSADNVYISAICQVGATLTVDVSGSACKDMDWTGAANSPTLALSTNRLDYFGNVTLIGAMSVTGNTGRVNAASSGAQTFKSNGCSLGCRFIAATASPTVTLLDALTTTSNNNPILFTNSNFNTGGFNVNAANGLIAFQGTTNGNITLGASIVSCVDWSNTHSALNLVANTSTINCSGNFTGGNVATYNIVNLTGATSTITGSNTFTQLNLASGTTQTITFTDGTTQTAGTFGLSGSAGHVHTLQGSGVAGWALTKNTAGYLDMDYLSVSRSTASPDNTFYAGTHSTNGGNNVRWYFTTPIISPPTNLVVSSNGVLTWALGTNASGTTIIRGTSAYPTSITDGVLIYSGTALTVTDANSNPDSVTYYYSAWGTSGIYTSATYTNISNGGTGVVFIGNMVLLGLFSILALAAMIGGSMIKSMSLAVGAAGFWAITGVFSYVLQSSTTGGNTTIYRAFFFVAVGLAIAAIIEASMIRRTAQELADEALVDKMQDNQEGFGNAFTERMSRMRDNLTIMSRSNPYVLPPDEKKARDAERRFLKGG